MWCKDPGTYNGELSGVGLHYVNGMSRWMSEQYYHNSRIQSPLDKAYINLLIHKVCGLVSTWRKHLFDSHVSFILVKNAPSITFDSCPRAYRLSYMNGLSRWMTLSFCRLCNLHMVTLLSDAPIFEWYLARLVVLNGYQNKLCYNEIGVCGQEGSPFS